MGHRRWLRDNDAWRKRKELFDGEAEPRKAPRMRSRTEIDMLSKNWKECPPPGKNSKRKAPEPLLKVWKTRSVFWDLSYWNILGVPHSLDVMHITKNVCESPLATLLNMPEKTKDGRKQGQTCYQWASGGSFTQTALMMMMMMMSRRRTQKVVAKAKRPRRANITASLLLHSKSEGDRAVYQLPPRSKTSLRSADT